VRGRDAHVGVQHTCATAHSFCWLEGGEDSILSIQRSQNAGGVARKKAEASRLEREQMAHSSSNVDAIVGLKEGNILKHTGVPYKVYKSVPVVLYFKPFRTTWCTDRD
jgi:hypothetical protein